MKPEVSPVVRAVVRIEGAYDHQPQGWYPRHDVNPLECRPIWRASGSGGVGESDFKPLPDAIDKCIGYVESHIRQAQQHLEKLKAARAAVEAVGEQ